MARVRWWFIDTFWLSQAYRSASYSVWQLTFTAVRILLHLATAGVTLYLRLLLYILLLIFQSSESPHLPVCHSVYICFNNISCFASSTHFTSTFILVWRTLMRGVEEKNQENNYSDTYICMCYRGFTFGVFPVLNRCGVVAHVHYTDWNQGTGRLDCVSESKVLLSQLLLKWADWYWWHFTLKPATGALLRT